MVASYYANRSIAYLQTEAFDYALQDASKSLEVDKNYIKVGMYSLKLFTLHIAYTYVLCFLMQIYIIRKAKCPILLPMHTRYILYTIII